MTGEEEGAAVIIEVFFGEAGALHLARHLRDRLVEAVYGVLREDLSESELERITVAVRLLEEAGLEIRDPDDDEESER